MKITKFTIITTLIILSIAFFYISQHIHLICKNIRKGLKNTTDSNEFCKYNKLNLCVIDLFYGVFDANTLLGLECSSHIESEDFSKYYDNYKYIGYPQTKNWSLEEREYYKYGNYVKKALKKSNTLLDTEY